MAAAREFFVPVWESVAPVHRVSFDLGDDDMVEASVGGEIALYFCRPDGTVYDCLLGMHSRHRVRHAILEAARLYREIGDEPRRTVAEGRRRLAALPANEASFVETLAKGPAALSRPKASRSRQAAPLSELERLYLLFSLDKSGGGGRNESWTIAQPRLASFGVKSDGVGPTELARAIVALDSSKRPASWKTLFFQELLGQPLRPVPAAHFGPLPSVSIR